MKHLFLQTHHYVLLKCQCEKTVKLTGETSFLADTLDGGVNGHGVIGSNMSNSMGGMGGMGHPPDVKPDISALQSPTSTHGSYYSYGHGMQPMPTSTQQSQGPPMHSTPLHSTTAPLGPPSMMSLGCVPPPSPPGMGMAHTTMGNKHICAICGDRASGKHYGVYRYSWIDRDQVLYLFFRN